MWVAFLLGLGGSLHCVGMCGPIAAIVPGGKGTSLSQKLGKSLSYNVGRIATYAALGAILGLFGKGIFLGGFQQGMSVTFGIIIIVGVLFPLVLKRFSPQSVLFSQVNKLKSFVLPLLQKKSMGGSFIIGVLNALLPCGLVYVAIAGAVLTGSPAKSAQYMALFGLGTASVMMLVSMGSNFLMDNYRRQLLKIVPIMIFIVGVLFVLRGLNLGIPYLSPKMEANQEVSCH